MVLMKSTRELALSKSKGFTLIELLVVIAIIGILSSVVLASLNSARKKGRDARRVSDLKQLQLALELYYDANPSTGYPASGLVALEAAVAPTYISVVPTDPSGGSNVYGYIQTGSGTGYCLGAILENTGQTSLLTNDNDTCGGASAIIGANTCATGTGGASEAVYCVSP